MGCRSSAVKTTSTEVVCEKEEIPVVKDFHDKYILGIKLGRGAFAQVRTCTKVSNPEQSPTRSDSPSSISGIQERAAKIIDLRTKNAPELTSRQLQKAAYNEASVWKTVGSHANCVRLYDVFYSAQFCYMVMEKCESGLLRYFENMPEMNERSFGSVFAQMLTGIAHTHSVKVVHRDVKPDNFLVGGDDGNTVKLGDFGLSAAMPKQGKLPGVFGTAPFMCPEMLGGRWYDGKADVWSLAVIAYVLLFGLFPYMPKEQSSKGMKQAILEGAIPPKFEPVGRSHGPNLTMRSPTAVTFVKTLLNREPEQRPSAEEALNMTYMTKVVEGNHEPVTDLPSLRSMLHAAKKVGAFEVRDPARESNIDVLLSDLQQLKHGRPLPVTPSAAPSNGHGDRKRNEDGSRSKNGKTSRVGPMGPTSSNPNAWEEASNRSTACGSSDMNDSSSSASIGFKQFAGSGWSRGTFMMDGAAFQSRMSSGLNSLQGCSELQGCPELE